MSEVLVTVLIAVYNEEKHIAECIESILAQTYKPIEIIVIDDGSTDGTADVVKKFGSVQLITQNHLGKAIAINRGAAQAKGEILFFLDGDMYFDRDYIERMIEPIMKGETIGTVSFDEYVANPENIWSKCLQIRSGLLPNRRLHLDAIEKETDSVVFRAIKREDFIRAGGFDNTGYLDDQTLYPKLGVKAKRVKDAVCYHYNPETLAEVFYSGKWGGKTIAINHGFSSIFNFMPFISIIRSFYSGLKFKYPSMAVYEFVYESGIFYGIIEFLVHRENVYGK
ncbi:MAG: hypothetical protein A3G39_02105 [Deltaproteobacteria bacterium RIFCSPLOWO2_12_FULL_43_16]|nr:MAG: hypothetical protein A3G39_02105 [Deltaproteobacteria bacterium RIFCSPLOWO2_12_FULL_43_16]